MASTRPDLRARLSGIGVTPAVVALALVWLVVFGPIVQDLSAQAAPRVALSGALVDDAKITIDDYPIDFDFTERDGHIYSDKAPGQEFLAVPVYAAGRLVGAEPAVTERVEGNLTLWWVTLWSSGLPAVALMLAMAVACHRRGTPIPIPALAGISFGTMLLPMGVTLYGHVLGALLGYLAWVVLDRAEATPRRAALAGALIGLAVAVEYQVALVGAVLAVALVIRRAWPGLVAFVAATIPFGLAIAAYHTVAYGSPFSSGYASKPDHEGATLFITGIPKPTTAVAMLFGSRGLLLFTPIVAVALWGLVRLWRRNRDEGVVVAIAVVAAFAVLQAGWVNAWGGGGPGPRYMIPMLPFLAIGLAAIWPSVPGGLRRFALGVSIASMGLASMADHLIPHGGFVLTSSLRSLVVDGPNPTVWSVALGPMGWLVYAGTVVAALIHLRRAWAEPPALLAGKGPTVGGGIPHALDGVALGDVEHPL